jgi:hypothetical protein
MAAKKPVDLIVRHETKDTKQRRLSLENDLTPKKGLTVRAPAQLTGNVERQVWQETIKLYLSLDARIVSVLDRGLLIDYCTACQQRQEIDDMRTSAMSNYLKSEAILQQVELSKQEVEPKVMLRLIAAVARGADAVLKLDARADNKRKMIHTLRQGLMLTPRSRGGVSPEDKPKKEPQSEMAMIIDGEAKPAKGQKRTRKDV